MSSDAGPDPRTPLWTGAAAFWVVGPLLYLAGGVSLLDAILLALLLAVMPALAIAQASVLDRVPFDRLSAYWSSIVTLWVIGATAWLVGTRGVGGAARMGLVGLPPLELAAWSAGLTATGLAIMVGFRVLGHRSSVRESRMLARLLPRTRRERRVFAGLSVAAGVGEEVAYRGYAISALASVLGVTGGVVVSSLVFGVLHAYQGLIGIVRTAVMGAVLAAGFVATGSLLPSMIAHTAIDLIAGLVLADWFLAEPGSSGTPGAEGHRVGRREGAEGVGRERPARDPCRNNGRAR